MTSQPEKTTHPPRRYAKACDACHKKKIKCLYNESACELCTKLGQECKFTRIEKAVPKRFRRQVTIRNGTRQGSSLTVTRGKHLVALEERMKSMEILLQQSRQKQAGKDEGPEPYPADMHTSEEALATIISKASTPGSKKQEQAGEIQFPTSDQALRLAQGYFVSFNHTFPIFPRESFMTRVKEDYPPDKHDDVIWWTTVITVLCFAHRLRAMSKPMDAEAENNEACRYFREVLDVAPRLTYGKPSIAGAQVLLGIASIFRGTPMPDPAPMLTTAAIRMLQVLDVHKGHVQDNLGLFEQKEREHVFWIAYIIDKDIALQARKPPVLNEQDISRPPPLSQDEDGVGVIRSLDSYFEVNLFIVSQRLASIQGQVWSRIHSARALADRASLQKAQSELNPILAAWKDDLPFKFRPEDLVGRWPKYAIVNIVTLQFRYFHTLVELNKEPPLEKDSPLNCDCPIAGLLPAYPYSTAMIAVEGARDALDLASLTPRGNFQNVWLFYNFSISAVLTLLVNGVVRPRNEHAILDLHRVDMWLRVIDILATSSERKDLLEKKEFLAHMRGWTVKAMQDNWSNVELAERCPGFAPDVSRFDMMHLQTVEENDPDINMSWMLGLNNIEPDVFPLHQIQPWEEWPNNVALTWPY